MKVCIYARVSTSHHDQNPEVQVSELKRYCSARGWENPKVLTDHGYSGGTTNRPGFIQLMKLARTREIDTVVCLKMDRLFRSLKHMVTTLEEFQSLGIQFIAVRDSVDWSTPSGRFFGQVLASLAEFEKSLLVERTLLGLQHARDCGKKLGRPLQRDDETILALRSKGFSYGAIQKQLGISKGSIYRAVKAVSKTF